MRVFSVVACLLAACPVLGQTDEQILRIKSDDIVLSLKEKNFGVLAAHMKPGGRLRFAPYVHLSPGDRLLSISQVRGFFAASGVKNWGEQDGTGDAILLTSMAYYTRFVYRRDFLTATSVTFNARVAVGNLPSNFATFYPGRAFFEYYVPAANPGDLDWSAINVVWQRDAVGAWRLVAIVNDEWTI